MDALLTSGLKHIDAVYFVAKKLVEAKLAPHQIGMGCFVYDRRDAYVFISRCGKRVTVYADCRGMDTSFDLIDIDGIVAQCKEYGFTAGSVTEDQLAKHREVVEKAWTELCQSLSTLKVDFKYDDVSFLWVNYKANFQRSLNLCLDPQDEMHVLVQIEAAMKTYRKEPKEAASVLQFAHDFPLKEEGEK